MPARPQYDPTIEIRLEKVIGNDGQLGGSRLIRFLTGRKAKTHLVRPHGIAWHDRLLVVTDPGAGQVVGIRGKKVILTRPGLFDNPIGVASCEDGVVVTDSRRGTVALLDSKLKLSRWLAEGLERPTGVACTGGLAFIAETGKHRVVVLPIRQDPRSGASGISAEIGSRGEADGEFNFPTALTIGRGSIWVGDTLNFRIQKFGIEDRAFQSAFGRLGDSQGEMPRVKGLVVDEKGRLWVSDAYLDRVALYTSEGEYLASIGGPGREPGEFSFPAGISLSSDGRLAVVDSLNRRIQIFQVRSRS